MNLFLVCYGKFPVILVAVGEGEGDNVVARKRDVELQTIGREARVGLHIAASGGSDFHGHLAEVLGEDHGEGVAVDGGLDGVAFWNALIVTFFNNDMAIAVQSADVIGSTPCCWHQQSKQQGSMF